MTNDKDEGLTMDKPTGAGEALAKKLSDWLEECAAYLLAGDACNYNEEYAEKLREAAALLTEQSRRQEAWGRSYNTVLGLIEVAMLEEPRTALARVVVQRLRAVRDAVEGDAPWQEAITEQSRDRPEPIRRKLAVLLDSLYGLHVRPGHVDAVLDVVLGLSQRKRNDCRS
jgi:hypothetical protein